MRRNFYKNRKPGPNVPPLGKLDTCLYLLAIFLSGGLLFGMAAVIMRYWDKMCALVAPDALCTSESSNFFLLMVVLLMLGALFGMAMERWEHRYPIFGNPGFSYGGDDWDPVFPVMMADENAPPEVRQAVRDARYGLMLWGLGLVAGVVLCLLALWGGTRLYPDGSIKTTTDFGKVTESYSPEQIDRLILRVDEPSSGRYGRSTWELELTIRTVDNKLIPFCVHDFVTGEGESEIDRLRQLLEQFPQERIRCENGKYLGHLYGRYGYDREDQEYLEALFRVD